MVTRILLVDDNVHLRGECRKIIESEGSFVVVGEAADGERAVEVAERLSPDVVIMDIVMPKMNGIVATRAIIENRPGTIVIALSNHSNSGIVEDLFNAGGKAYITKEWAFEELILAIRTALEGSTFRGKNVSRT
jgi:DNA-binding NarL/FixJ family response regulator